MSAVSSVGRRGGGVPSNVGVVATTRLYSRCGACGSPCGSGEKYCLVCGNDLARLRAQASAQITEAKRVTRLDTADIEAIYFHFVFGHYRSPELARMSREENVACLKSMRVIEDNAVLSSDERDALRLTQTAILFQDYCQAMAHLVNDAESKEIFRYLFQVYDADVDGRLDRTELHALLNDHVPVDTLLLTTDGVGIQEEDKERARTRMYTWLKRQFNRYAKDGFVTLSAALRLLTETRYTDGDLLLEKLRLNVQNVAIVVDRQNMKEFRMEAAKIYGAKAASAFTTPASPS